MASLETIPDQNVSETQSTDLNLFLWNPGVNKSVKGVSAVRNMIVAKVVKTVEQLKPKPVMFLQESLSASRIEGIWGVNKRNYHVDGRITGSSGHRSGLYTPPSETLHGQEDCNLTTYFVADPVAGDLDDCTVGQIIHLGHRSKLFKAKLVLISVHMPKKGKDSAKKGRIVAFFNKMCSLANDQRTTVVVGGDFNLDVSKWEKATRIGSRVQVLCYNRSPYRRGDFIDTFAIVYPENKEYCIHVHLNLLCLCVHFL